MHDLILHLY